MNIERSALRLDNVTLHYTAAGHGHPVILLHGLAGSDRWWAKNIQALARHFRVYALDMAGFGRSRGQPFALEESAALLLRWLDALNIQRCHVVAHSMGGNITTRLLTFAPDVVERAVLVDAAVLPIRRPLPVVGWRLLAALRYMPFDFWPVLFTDTLRAGPLTMLRASYAILRGDLSEQVARIQTHLMIIWGEHDTLLPLAMGEELHRLLPAAHYVVIKGAGHNPMWDRPQVFNPLVIDFLLGENEKKNEPASDKLQRS